MDPSQKPGPSTRLREVREAVVKKKKVEGLGTLCTYALLAINTERKAQIDLLRCHPFPTVPGPPTSLILSSPSETEMTLHWTPPSQENGILVGYLLQYKECMSAHLHCTLTPITVMLSSVVLSCGLFTFDS